jgi:hypothetical protein
LLNKATYSFACWLIPNRKEVFFIEDTISLFITCSVKYLKSNEYNDTIDLLVLAFNLAKLYQITKYNSRISDAALAVFYSVVDTEHARWMIEPIEVFVQLNKRTDPDLINKLMTILHHEAHKFNINGNSHLERSLLHASLELCSLIDLDSRSRDKLRKTIHSMIAKSHEIDADGANNPDNALAAVQFYRDAQLEYENAGNNTKVKELNEKIREASGKIQYKVFKHELTIPDLKLEGKNGYELIVSFCKYNGNIPRVDRAEKQVKDLMKKYPISNIARNIPFNKRNPLSYGDNDGAVIKSRMNQQIIMAIRLGERQLSLAMKKHEDEKKITEQDAVSFITDTGIYDMDQLTLIKSGIHDHFAGNYIAAIHTLIPQIEGTLRLLLKSRGISTLKTKGEIIMDNELGGLLSKPEVEDILSSDFTNYLKVKYSSPDGLNLRNNVSHALSSLSDFNYEASLTIIHTICKIARLSVDNVS